MEINVAQLLKDPLGAIRYYSIDEVAVDDFPVQGTVKLVLTNRSILVVGQFETVVKCDCIRCLEEFRNHIRFDIEEEFFPAKDMISGFQVPIPDDADAFTINENHILDLSEALRQNILLNLPANPVCHPECAGLCPECGQNLNLVKCNCREELKDPRWYPLKELFPVDVVESVNEVN